ncbi:MAG: DUF481 domain-containing protein [Spirochaetota bacterium]|nr:DUF481 domain-containing protein [Spirochaetota bacterium]
MRSIIVVIYLLMIIITSAAIAHSEESEEESFLGKCFSFVPKEKKGPDEKKWFYTLSGWYNKKEGNTNTLSTNFASSLEINNNISSFIISYAAFYEEVDKERKENKGTGVIKFDHYITNRIELFIFSQSDFNKETLLDHRYNTGTGAKLDFIRNEILTLDISAAILYQYENYKSESPTDDYRWSMRFRIKFSPIDIVKCGYTYFYIPKIDDGMSYRLDLDTFMSIEVAKNLSFKIGYTNQYNKNAIEGTKKTDENLYSQISIHL